MALAIGAEPLMSAHSSFAGMPGEVFTQGDVKQVWSSRGEGWGNRLSPSARKIGTDEGGLSQSPPFFLCVWQVAAIPLLAL